MGFCPFSIFQLRNNIVLYLYNKIFQKSKLLSEFIDYFYSLICPNKNSNIGCYLFLLGASVLTYKSIYFVAHAIKHSIWISKHFINQTKIKKQNLIKKYGNGWIVITGFTQGIGWEFVQTLLSLGMKLVLVGRNRQKINKKVQYLNQKFSKCQVKVVVGDLSISKDIKDVCYQLQELSKTIDISIIINNAGVAGFGNIISGSPEDMLIIEQTNLISLYEINKTMIPILEKRQHRSAIINVSSCTGKYISPSLLTYPLTKQIVYIYSKYLLQQHKQKIDVLVALPFGVTTPMMKMRKQTFEMISPRSCVDGVIGDLIGNEKQSFTGFKHKLISKVYQNLTEQKALHNFAQYWSKMK